MRRLCVADLKSQARARSRLLYAKHIHGLPLPGQYKKNEAMSSDPIM